MEEWTEDKDDDDDGPSPLPAPPLVDVATPSLREFTIATVLLLVGLIVDDRKFVVGIDKDVAVMSVKQHARSTIDDDDRR